ncbi:AraC family transcriptional regulator [Enterococcus sp. ALS3]|uniref:AraC family transcriptional regulator n=1 Tax=Enterococcus alishanensis TaxID=1303817 RepID=A0ABS6TH84_9ENTE|nr:AraC family transcriptional regulator [Enterococcus alishanensis]MBV7392246.1 AraC family transcriptional regulator [Enterococcus alishanensis]
MNKNKAFLATVSFIEANLLEELSLEQIGREIGYSKYYLAHEFKELTCFTTYDYVKKRRLNEAAKHLISTEDKIIDISLNYGYQEQRTFTKAFTEIFKITPKKFRENQQSFEILDSFQMIDFTSYKTSDLLPKIPQEKHLESILNLMKQIKDGFPYLSLEQLKKVILRKMATGEIVVAFLGNTVVGLMIVDLKASSIELLDSLPTLWGWDIERLLLDFARENFLFASNFLSTTSFREKDKLDIGRRERLLRLNFIPTKKSINFSYPTEDFLLKLP